MAIYAWAKEGHIWVHTQKGVESSLPMLRRQPGMPVAEQYRKHCPKLWVDSGWVEEVSNHG